MSNSNDMTIAVGAIWSEPVICWTMRIWASACTECRWFIDFIDLNLAHLESLFWKHYACVVTVARWFGVKLLEQYWHLAAKCLAVATPCYFWRSYIMLSGNSGDVCGTSPKILGCQHFLVDFVNVKVWILGAKVSSTKPDCPHQLIILFGKGAPFPPVKQPGLAVFSKHRGSFALTACRRNPWRFGSLMIKSWPWKSLVNWQGELQAPHFTICIATYTFFWIRTKYRYLL